MIVFHRQRIVVDDGVEQRAHIGGTWRLVAILVPADLPWDIATALSGLAGHQLFTDSAALIAAVTSWARAGDALLVMSNGAFDNVHARLLVALEQQL